MTMLSLLTLAMMLVVLPLLAARDAQPMRGLKKTVVWVAAFNLFFVFFLRVVIPRLG
jgi:formate-dependent nitrite reductase membrane component NrfD